MALARVAVVVLALAARASAQPVDPYAPADTPATPATPAAPLDATAALHDANAAATAGDWARVSTLVDPLLVQQLARADLAEAHRLAGLAAFFSGRRDVAEAQFVAYLKLDLDGKLDPALVPPDAVTFFENVKFKHAAELRALRPHVKRRWAYNLVPPFGQFQNGETTKGIVLAGMMGAFGITNVTTYFVLRSWCTSTSGPAGTGASCDTTVDRSHTAASLRTLNITTGVAFIATYLYGVYDGVVGYRRRSHEQMVMPYATAANDGFGVGVVGSF